MENCFFANYLSDPPETLSFYTALQNNTTFYNNFFGFEGEALTPPPPAGAPVNYLLENYLP